MGRLAKSSHFIFVAAVWLLVLSSPASANDAPTASGIEDRYGLQPGVPVVVDLAAAFNDPNGDELTFSLLANSATSFVSVQVDNATDQLTVMRTAGQFGRADLTIQASDGATSTSTTFSVTDLQLVVWTGGGADSSWNTSGNWSPNIVPSTGNAVLLDSGSKNVQLTVDNVSVGSLFVETGYTGTVDLNSRSLNVFGDLDLGVATVAASGSTINLAGSRPVLVSGPAAPIGNLTIATANEIRFETEITVGGTLRLTTVNSLQGSAIRVSGNVVTTDPSYSGTAPLELVGVGPQQISAGGNAMLRNVDIDKPSGTATFGPTGSATTLNNLRLEGGFIHQQGTVDLTNVRKITFSGTMSEVSAPLLTFNNVELAGNFSAAVTGDLEINGDLTISAVSGFGASGIGYLNVRGDVTSSDGLVNSTVGIRFTGSQNQTISGHNTDLTNGDLIVDKTAGTVTLAHGMLAKDGSQQLRIVSGTFDVNGQSLFVGNGVVVEGGTLTGATTIDRQQIGDVLTVTSGTVSLIPGSIPSVALGGGLALEGGTLELDLTDAVGGSQPNLLASTSSRTGTFDEIVVVNNGAGFEVTPLYGASSVGANLVLPNNPPTVTGGLADRFEFGGSTTLTVAGAFGDGDNDPLTYSVESNSAPSFVTASISGSQLTLSQVAGQVGHGTITIRATDPAGAYATTSFRVTDASHVWTGDGPTDAWDDSQNWLPASVPGASDVAVIDSEAAEIEVASDQTVGSLRLEAGFTGGLSLDPGIEFTVSDALIQHAGAIDLSDAILRLGGRSEFLGGGVVTGGSTLVLQTGASFDSNGVEWNHAHLQRVGEQPSILLDSDLLVAGNLMVGGAVTITGAHPLTEIRVRGNFSGLVPVLSGTVPMVFDGAADQLIAGSFNIFGPDARQVVIDKPSGTVTLGLRLGVHTLALRAGTLDLDGNTLTASGNLDLSGGTLLVAGATIALIESDSAESMTFTGPSSPIHDLTIVRTSPISIAGDVDIEGLVTLTSVGTLDGSSIRAAGDVHTDDTGYSGTAQLELVGADDQHVTAGSAVHSLRNIWIDKPSGVVEFEDALQFQGGFVHVSGAVEFGDPSGIDHTATFTGPALALEAPGLTFDHVRFSGGAAGQLTGAFRVGGRLTIAEMSGSTVAGPDGQIVALGDVISTDADVDSVVTIRLAGSGDQTVSGGDPTDGDIIVDKPSGRVLLADALETDGSGQRIVVSGGTLETGSNTIVADGGVLVNGGVLSGGGTIEGSGGLTVTSGSIVVDPDDASTAFDVQGDLSLDGTLMMDLAGVPVGSYLDLLTTVGSRTGAFATLSVSNNDSGFVVNARYDVGRAGVTLGEPIAGQIDDVTIELPAHSIAIDLAEEFGRNDLTFSAQSNQEFVTTTIDPATPGVLDLHFAPGTTGTASIMVDVSSTDSGTDAITFDVALIDTIDPAISVGAPTADAEFAHDAPVPVNYGCDDAGGTAIVSCVGSIDGTPVQSGVLLAALEPGDHSLVVDAADTAGNVALTRQSFTVLAALTADLDDRTIDLPAAPTSIDLAAAFGESDLTYQVLADHSFVTPTVDGDEMQLTYESAITGTSTITINAQSSSGANGGAAFTVTLRDDVAPVISISSPVANEAFAHDESIPVEFSCDAGGGTAVTSCTAVVQGVEIDDLELASGASLDALPAGDYGLVVNSTDGAQNPQLQEHTFTVLDELAGVVEPLMLTLPAETQLIDLNDVFGRTGLTFVAESNQTYVRPTLSGGTTGQLLLDVTPGATGTAEVTVAATSEAGARGSLRFTMTLVDDADPLATISSPAMGDRHAYGEPIAYRFACDDLGGAPIVSCAGRVDGQTVANGSITSALVPGAHRLVIEAIDAAGHRSRETRAFTVAEPVRRSRIIGTEFEGSQGLSGTVARLYVAVFDRAPDAAGHAYWNAQVSDGMSLMELTVLLVRSPEYRSIYDTPANADFVEHVYRNVLRRPADPAGKAYWVEELGDEFDRAHLVLLVAESIESKRFSNTG